MRFFFPLLTILFFLTSCEEVIDVKLQDAAPKVVIEGAITSGKGPFYVRLSYSQPYFNQNQIVTINDADVEIKSRLYTDKLTKKGSGYYATNNIIGIPGWDYQLSVKIGTENFAASVQIPSKVPIDSIYFREGIFNKDSLNVFVEFQDPPKIENYYRIKVYRNKRYAPNDYYMIDDAFADGERIWAPFYSRDFSPGDTVLVELYNMERNTWRYMKALGITVDQSVNSQAPGNPPSNISGGVLGYFGAWNVSSRETIAIKSYAVKKP